jgi:hypothetical protein
MTSRLAEALPGTWLLRSRIDVTREGRRHPDPLLGEDPVALVFFDPSGHFAAQFMKRDRSAGAPVPSPSASSAPRNNTQSQGGYDAYFGTFAIVDERTVETRLLAALTPGNVGLVLTRRMEVAGDTLVIRLETTAVDGTPVTRSLTWDRATRAK